jgi:hypothetical protein
MNMRLWKRPLERQSTYMPRTKVEQLSKSLGKIKRKKFWIRGRKDSNLLFS